MDKIGGSVQQVYRQRNGFSVVRLPEPSSAMNPASKQVPKLSHNTAEFQILALSIHLPDVGIFLLCCGQNLYALYETPARCPFRTFASLNPTLYSYFCSASSVQTYKHLLITFPFLSSPQKRRVSSLIRHSTVLIFKHAFAVFLSSYKMALIFGSVSRAQRCLHRRPCCFPFTFIVIAVRPDIVSFTAALVIHPLPFLLSTVGPCKSSSPMLLAVLELALHTCRHSCVHKFPPLRSGFT